MPEINQLYRLASSPTLDNLRLAEEPIPAPGAGEALVRIHASSLNYHDYLVVSGLIPVKTGLIPMSDGAGEVVDVAADVVGVKAGDRVMGAFFPQWLEGLQTWGNNVDISGETCHGFAAQYVTVPARSLVAMPAGWSYEEAATLPCAGLTAWRALCVEGEFKAGDNILVPGSGGLALFMIQLGSALGINVFSISSSDSKLEKLIQLGASGGLNYRDTPEWGTAARALCQNNGLDMVLDIGGESTFKQSVEACRMAGRVIVVGSTSNQAPVIPLTEMIMRHIRVQGMAVGSVAMLQELVRFIDESSIRPIIDRCFDLPQLADAFRYQLSGKHFGKIVIKF